MDGVGTVEGQRADEGAVSGAGDDAHEVAGAQQAHTGSRAHQGAVMQRPADGSIAVRGHGREQANSAMPNREKKDSWVKQLAGGMVGQEERRSVGILETTVVV